MLTRIKQTARAMWHRTDKTQKKQRKKRPKWVRNTIIVALIVAVGGGGTLAWFQSLAKPVSATQQTALVTRGSITKSIEGSGTIEAIEQYEVTSLVKGEILADYFEEGQEIEQGALMYEIDTTDLTNSIQQANANLEKAQLSYEESVKALENLTVTAPVTGVVQELYIKEGDNVQSGAQVAEIINTEQMLLTIDFLAADAQHLYVGAPAEVTLENSFTTLTGSVSKVASGALANSEGVQVSSVEILVDNPGGILPDSRATAVVAGYACNSAGTFSYSEQQTVLTKASGEVTGLTITKGDQVNRGDVLLQLDSESTVNSVRQNELSLEQSRLSLQNTNDQLDDYRITAPISGKVIQKTSKTGDKLDNTNSNTVMAIIADLSTLVFEISVDELDIASIQEGQTVQVTADALEGQVFTGYVDNVSIVGTSTNGVTSYPVKVVLDQANSEGLIPGMNVSASIVIDSREDVLRVPLSAVRRGNLVIAKTDAASSDEAQADDTTARQDGAWMAGGPSGGDMQLGEMPEGAPEGMPEGGMLPAGDAGDTAPAGESQEAPSAQESMAPSDAASSSDASADTGTSGAASDAARERLTDEVPSGYTVVQVETGLSDDNFIEITSGLSEGDTVLLPDVSASATSEEGMQGGMMGMGGGMPGGGMPGGGGGGMPGGGGGGMPGGGGGAPAGR